MANQLIVKFVYWYTIYMCLNNMGENAGKNWCPGKGTPFEDPDQKIMQQNKG